MYSQYFKLFSTVLIVTTLLMDKSSEDDIREQKKKLVNKYMKRLKKQEGTIRLVNGRGPFEGNIEIHHSGKWGSVCDDEWDAAEADVACRYLGYERAERATHDSFFGIARRKFWMDNLYCTGKESYLSECRFDGWGVHDCTEAEAAGVVCHSSEALITEHPEIKQPTWRKIKDKWGGKVKIRLQGGRIPSEGRVEAKTADSDWSVICGDGWSLLEASVVCRELNLGYASNAIQTDFFGGEKTKLVLGGITCRGNESTISECLQDELDADCPGGKDNIAAVVCTNPMADLVIDYDEIMRTTHLEDRQLYFLQCAMEENCLASQAYEIRKENAYNWQLETRRLLRFTARIINLGTADFRPFVPKHLWEWHSCHMHYHSMEVFATFDILNKEGTKVAEGHKASFCLEDNQCLPDIEPVYACANFGDQGISVNCSDIYRHNIDCQWVDISELSPGTYQFKVSINPEFKVPEMSFENNAALCTLYYTETYAFVNNCTHIRP